MMTGLHHRMPGGLPVGRMTLKGKVAQLRLMWIDTGKLENPRPVVEWNGEVCDVPGGRVAPAPNNAGHFSA
jgi:hypothetical protein